MSFVAECKTMSAPSSIGRCRSGVANVASTTVIAPRSRAPATIAGTSATTMSGLAIDSTHTMSAPSAAAMTGISVVDRYRADLEAAARLHQIEDVPHAVVRRRGQRHGPTRRHEGGDRGGRCEARGERHGLSTPRAPSADSSAAHPPRLLPSRPYSMLAS